MSTATPAIAPIETSYKGYRFRSRLEARWAVLLDHLKISWLYEHQGYKTEHGLYLPDFWLPELNTFLEIKALKPLREEKDKLRSVINAQKAFGAFGLSLADKEHVLAYWPYIQHDYGREGFYPWPASLPRSKDAFHYKLNDLKVDEYENLVCPACGAPYVHAGSPVFLEEDYPHKHVHRRGPITCIPMWSELCSHQWELVVAFHKGNTEITACMPFDGHLTPLEVALSGDDGLSAINAARAARFEHGESP
jgi:hypothetical protein